MPVHKLADSDRLLPRGRTDSWDSVDMSESMHSPNYSHANSAELNEDLTIYGRKRTVIEITGTVFNLLFASGSYVGVGAALYTAGYFIAAALGTTLIISSPISIACMFLALAIAMPITYRTKLSKLCGNIGQAIIQFPLAFALGGMRKGIYFVNDWFRDVTEWFSGVKEKLGRVLAKDNRASAAPDLVPVSRDSTPNDLEIARLLDPNLRVLLESEEVGADLFADMPSPYAGAYAAGQNTAPKLATVGLGSASGSDLSSGVESLRLRSP